jgi:N2227-like protein
MHRNWVEIMVEWSHSYFWWRGLGLSLLVVAVSMAVACTVQNSTHRPLSSAMIPFLFLEEPSWRDLHVMVEKYREDSARLLHGLSQSLELALHSEREMGLPEESQSPLFSKFLKSKIDRVATALEHNEEELKKLMKPFPVRLMLPTSSTSSSSPSASGTTAKNTIHKNNTPNNLFTIPKSYGKHDVDKNAYDCGAQVIAHMVRDWTPLGKPVRAHTYAWCCQMSLQYIRSPGASILVPGAGLGRLAFELFQSSFAVEANELSLSMATAAQAILQDHQHGILYPFALDGLANEVIAEQRFDTTEYPDTIAVLSTTDSRGSLSYTVGADFVHAYRWQRPPSTFAGVVTCFFLDTATNVYEYISTIHYSLPPGGIWINIGPLRWHRNSLLHPASDELQQILSSFQFEILQWTIDPTPMEYRDSESNFVRSTFYEGYRALRFVLRKR